VVGDDVKIIKFSAIKKRGVKEFWEALNIF
jgi:hypothetical protein